MKTILNTCWSESYIFTFHGEKIIRLIAIKTVLWDRKRKEVLVLSELLSYIHSGKLSYLCCFTDLLTILGLWDAEFKWMQKEFRGGVWWKQLRGGSESQVLQHRGQWRHAPYRSRGHPHVGGRGQSQQPVSDALHILSRT